MAASASAPSAPRHTGDGGGCRLWDIWGLAPLALRRDGYSSCWQLWEAARERQYPLSVMAVA